ncbi:MAG: hypothetical protein Q8O76_15730, partial [Chloroflexota bacterium]|nr:hypothetical protein [Chloroflexota bacterium]
ESGATAVKRLLEKVPDVLFFRGHWAYSKNPQPGDASDYGYGTDHPVLAGRYASHAPEANRVQVYGSGVFKEVFSWPDLEKAYDRLHQVHDLNLDTEARAQARGEAELRLIQRAATGGEVVVPVNCGQELYDVIDLTDPRAGIAAAKRRVLGLALTYGTGERARYQQRLLLGGV